MRNTPSRAWRRHATLTAVSLAALIAACGGDDTTVSPPVDADLALCNGTAFQQVLNASATGPAETNVAVQDIKTLRVHYRRTDGNYAGWGLHMWDGGGVDTTRLPAGVNINVWNAPVPFTALPGYAAGANEIVFEVPVLNPKDDANRKDFKFIIHGMGVRATRTTATRTAAPPTSPSRTARSPSRTRSATCGCCKVTPRSTTAKPR